MNHRQQAKCPLCGRSFTRLATHRMFCGEGAKQRARRQASVAGGRKSGGKWSSRTPAERERVRAAGRKGWAKTFGGKPEYLREVAVKGGVARGKEVRQQNVESRSRSPSG